LLEVELAVTCCGCLKSGFPCLIESP